MARFRDSPELVVRRIFAAGAIAAFPLGIAANVIASMGIDFQFDLMTDQSQLITLGPKASSHLHAAWVLDVCAYYVLMIPVAVYLHGQLRERARLLADVGTLCGLAYAVVGAALMSSLAAVLPPLSAAYDAGDPSTQGALLTTFAAITEIAFVGVAAVEFLFAGLWWLLIGLAMGSTSRPLAGLSIGLGAATLLAAASLFLRGESWPAVEWFPYLLGPIWGAWVGVRMWRGPTPEPG